MIAVKFTQFLMPYGRQRPMTIMLDEGLKPQVDAVAKSGCRFTAEILSTGLCSFCIEEPELGDFDQVLCANGPGVREQITEMVCRFKPEAFAKWKKQMQAVEKEAP